jgi:hypothetical protein
MESLQKIKDLIEKMSVETTKVTQRGNHSASIRARKYAQEIKSLIPVYRKDILKKIQSQNASD